jgi:predicted component of type VI protein secretion system
VSRFRLLWRSRNLELEIGAILFGRGDECVLRTDDPLVSRQHARITVSADQVRIEDLGSRNGVVVNGERISQVTSLDQGDRIKIGSQELILLHGRITGSWSEPPAPTRRFDALGLLGELAEKAMALSRFDEAERLVEGPFQQLVDDVTMGREVSPAVVAKATDLAVRLAASTLKGDWIDRLTSLYSKLRRPWPAEAVDTLYVVARRLNSVDRAALRAYIAILRESQLGPADRFLLGRIDGLERQLALP